VDASFLALRETVERQAGWDFLGRLDNVFWALDRRVEPGESFRSWHKTGRAFAIVQSYNQGTPAQVEVVIDPRSTEVYWNLFVRASVQDGTLGEPLRDIPWDFYARTGGDPDAYEDGGTLKPAIPGGYYVDFTATARVYGWEPVASDSAWNYNWPSIRYWQYVKTDGLDWLTAASEIYPPGALEEVFGTSTGGIPSPVTPTLLPPATIETEETLSATPTSGNDKQDSN
jgi:hypothetical protein